MGLKPLGPAPLSRLRERLAATRAALPAGTPGNALLSITLSLEAPAMAGGDWLAADLARPLATAWAQPARDDWRLALGHALLFCSAGPARFSALQAAFAGVAPHWWHDDADGGAHPPLAHIGFAFDEEAADCAPDELPNARLAVPAILLRWRAEQASATFTCTLRDAGTAIERWQAELAAAAPARPAATAAQPGERRPAPLAERAYLARVRAALAGIAQGELAKVVLARSAGYAARRRIDPAAVLAALASRHPECTLYGIGQPGRCFLGATPERLVTLAGGIVRADALAGTVWEGDTTGRTGAGAGATDAPQALDGDKNRREQQLVVDAVRDALAPLCARLDAPQAAEVMTVRELRHLRTSVAGRVLPGVGLFDLIARLHPTPAVGGTPEAAARRWLRAHRERRPAWYTGGIGWIDRAGDGEIAVALRCARLDGAQAELFAGAGIVAGSDPRQELAETEAKLGPLLAALAAAATGPATSTLPSTPGAGRQDAHGSVRPSRRA